MTAGEKLKKLVKTSQLNAGDAAKKMGISRSNLFNLYNQDNFEGKTTQKIITAFDLPSNYFDNSYKIGAEAELENARKQIIELSQKVIELQEKLMGEMSKRMELEIELSTLKNRK